MSGFKNICYIVLLYIGLCSCATSRLCKKYDAVNEKKIKRVYYIAKENGDTVKTNYKLEMSDILFFNYTGFPDSLITYYIYKGKPFTGKSLSIIERDKDYLERWEIDLMPGVYKTFTHYTNGKKILTETYFPNGTLHKKIKGEFRGELYSELYEVYDVHGNLLKRHINQPGIQYKEYVKQYQGEYKVERFFGGNLKKVEVLDTTLPYEIRYEVIRKIEIGGDYDEERILITHKYDKYGFINEVTDEYSYKNGCCKSYDWCYDNFKNDLFIEKHQGGRLKTAGQYKEGKPHGTWNYYTPDGKLEKIERYTFGNKHFIRYDDKGYVFFSIMYDKESGQIIKYRNDSVPIYYYNEYHTSNGYKRTLRIYKDDSTAYPKESLPYVSNRYFEYVREYKQDTLYRFYCEYSDDYWYKYTESDGKSMSKIREEDIAQNRKKEYWPDGRVKSYGSVSPKSKRDGIWIDFSHFGDTIVVSTYHNGFLHGVYEEYHSDRIQCTGQYIHGKKSGNWLFYNKKGEVEREELY